MFLRWKRDFRRKARRGLTLVELAIVVLVLSAIMGVVFYNLRESASDVQAGTRRLQVGQFQANRLPMKLEEYLNAGGMINYGDDLTVLMEEIPGTSYEPAKEELVMDPWGSPYFLCQGDDGSDRICSLGKDRQEGGEGENADFQLDDEKTWPAWLKRR